MIHLLICKNTATAAGQGFPSGGGNSRSCRARLLQCGLQLMGCPADPSSHNPDHNDSDHDDPGDIYSDHDDPGDIYSDHDDPDYDDPGDIYSDHDDPDDDYSAYIEEMLLQGPDGKPFFRDHPEIHFNLSHSGAYIACAFSSGEVGLDIQETCRPYTDPLRIAKRFFTPEEYNVLAGLASSRTRQTLFFRLWSIKEAFLKYRGCGLRGSMDSFLPDPIPLSCHAARRAAAHAAHVPEEIFAKGDNECEAFVSDGISGDLGCLAAQGSGYPAEILLQGRIRVLKEQTLAAHADHAVLSSTGHPPLPSPDYAVLRAPDGYVMAICADNLHEEIRIHPI